jgi:hypothetical protein
MKNQYLGDRRDFFKFDLLLQRAVTEGFLVSHPSANRTWGTGGLVRAQVEELSRDRAVTKDDRHERAP